MTIVRQSEYVTIITEHDDGSIFKSTQNAETGEMIEHGVRIDALLENLYK